MKTKNYTREYYIETISRLRYEIRQTIYRIITCEHVCRKEKQLLNNSKTEHTNLWLWRDKLKYYIRHKQQLHKQLRIYERLLSVQNKIVIENRKNI